jgi:hypothetical protein
VHYPTLGVIFGHTKPPRRATGRGCGRLVGVDVPEPTRTQAPRTDPVPAGRCDYHDGPSETAVIVDTIERQSAPPIAVYACAPCREQRRLTPLADQW